MSYLQCLRTYASPEDREEARRDIERWEDERADSERERKRDIAEERPASPPNPILRAVTVSGEEVKVAFEWGATSEGTVHIESATDLAGECLVEHIDRGDLRRVVEDIRRFFLS